MACLTCVSAEPGSVSSGWVSLPRGVAESFLVWISGSKLRESSQKEAIVVLLWVLVALLLLFAIVGGVAITKFLFFVLIVAALLALIGFFARRTA